MKSPVPFVLAVLLLCVGSAASAQPTLDVTKLGYDRGSENAPITIIEFGDFACSACGLFARESMPIIQRDWVAKGRVRIKYIPFIIGMFPRAEDAARAAECAAEQDAFWPMHDVLYERQREWTGLGQARPHFEGYAKDLGLNLQRFRSCWDADRGKERIETNNAAARTLQIRGTPTFFVNGARIQGAIPADRIQAFLEAVAAQR